MEVIDDRLLQEAARWHARLHASDCTKQEHAAFESWRDASAAHAAAFARAEKTMAGLDRLLADSRLQALVDRAVETPSRRAPDRPSSRWTLPAALAAGLALAAVGVHVSVLMLHPSEQVAYETAGERRTVTLEDGSTVQLDIGTELHVRMSEERREIDLLKGRALFEVAHDAARPFSVAAADARTTALGTKFQVQRDEARVLVTLTEGSVVVDGVSPVAGWQERLVPGEQLSFDMKDAGIDKYAVDLQRVTSWMRGRHVFRDTPLAEVVSEVNRYAGRKVRLGDSSLAELPVGGSFIAGDSELIVDALSAVLPIRAVAGGGNEIILFRRYE
jgi:transmembrane sensor